MPSPQWLSWDTAWGVKRWVDIGGLGACAPASQLCLCRAAETVAAAEGIAVWTGRTHFPPKATALALKVQGNPSPPILLLLLVLPQDFGLHKFAADFAEAGLAAFVFDYRGWGGSGGARHTDMTCLHHLLPPMLYHMCSQHTRASTLTYTQHQRANRPSARSAAAACSLCLDGHRHSVSVSHNMPASIRAITHSDSVTRVTWVVLHSPLTE